MYSRDLLVYNQAGRTTDANTNQNHYRTIYIHDNAADYHGHDEHPGRDDSARAERTDNHEFANDMQLKQGKRIT